MTPEQLVRDAFTNGVPGSADKTGWQGLQCAVFSVLDALAARDAEWKGLHGALVDAGDVTCDEAGVRELVRQRDSLRAEVARLTRRTEELEAAAGEWGVEQDRRHRIAIEGMDHLLRKNGFSDNNRERVVAFMCGLLPLQRPLTEAEKDYALTLRPSGAAPTEGGTTT